MADEVQTPYALFNETLKALHADLRKSHELQAHTNAINRDMVDELAYARQERTQEMKVLMQTGRLQ